MVAIAAQRTDCSQPLEVLHRFARLELRGERRRIGRDHRVLPETALQSEAGHAEIRVLVVHLAVAAIEGRFRNAPGNALGTGVVDLPADDQPAGVVEQPALRLLHDQRRHQILEHRARPGHQRAAEADLDDGPAEAEPMLRG